MKKIVVRVLGVLGAVLALGVLGVVVKFYLLSPRSRPAPDMKAPSTPEAVERGRYRGLTAEDKDALFAALRQVPAVSNVVPPSKTK